MKGSTAGQAPRLRDFAKGALAILKNARTISFSQYGEDVLIHNLRPARRGTYVDVGAFHPWKYSNTYKLYLRGWSGITVEPNPEMVPLFRKTRPRDVHLNNGISPSVSRLTYYRFENGVFNSFHKSHAERVGETIIEEIPVACLPLQDVMDTHLAGRPADLLSVDCEGMDLSVLQSLDWRKTRPSAIIVEDFDQFENNCNSGGLSEIRSFLIEQDYALFTQCVYSFLYVDRQAFYRPHRSSGFLLDGSHIATIAGVTAEAKPCLRK